MQKLSLIILVLVLSFQLFGQESPHGKNFDLDCLLCHTTESWKIDAKKIEFDHSSTKFTLLGQHSDVNCRSCHTDLSFKNVSNDCESCHNDVHENTVGFDCARCHTPTSWLVSDVLQLHRMSRFPLLGVHQTADCSDCHISNSLLKFEPLSVECVDCHQGDYQSAKDPDHVKAGFSTNCSECHTESQSGWSASQITHNFFPLIGGHAIANCFECHNQNDFSGLSQDCYSCHQNDYNSTTNPSHVDLGFSKDCQSCHNISGWTPATFEHDNQFFPIYSGKHKSEWNQCTDCHTNGNDYNTFSCITCHDHNQSSMDNEHKEVSGYVYESPACYSCHPNGDSEGSQGHTLLFPLTGSHSGLPCADCHTADYASASSECFSCHSDNYNNSVNPNHQSSGISQQCETCHQTTSWKPSTFNHSETGFQLMGGHLISDCSQCHIGNTNTAKSECASCHLEVYSNAINPNHQSVGISLICETCHQTSAWVPSTFNHSETGFQLMGGHLISDCSQCHIGNTNTAKSECASCHLGVYNNAINPNHQSAGISLICETCHQTSAWIPSIFNHSGTGFQLLGGHQISDCSQCHLGNTNTAKPECASCHLDNYNSAKEPDHILENYPKECEVCHNTVNWNESTFNHNLTSFPLTGSHFEVECTDCHQNGYSELDTKCLSCHESDFNNTTNPSHTSLILSFECEVCHTTMPGWKPAKFPDHNNYYQLLGAHSTISENCSDCHMGNYIATPNLCYSCHSTEYNNSTNPSHQGAQFPTECEECHTQNAWIPSTFDHDSQYFPINSGKHREAWNECIDCHTVASNYGVFSCIDCHEHNQSEMDNKHREESDYRYESAACFDCHPNGSSDEGGIPLLKMQKIMR